VPFVLIQRKPKLSSLFNILNAEKKKVFLKTNQEYKRHSESEKDLQSQDSSFRDIICNQIKIQGQNRRFDTSQDLQRLVKVSVQK